mgnify:CR=1 FL=1
MLCLIPTRKYFLNLLTILNEVSLTMNLKMPLKEQRKVVEFNLSIHQMEYGIQKFLKKVISL